MDPGNKEARIYECLRAEELLESLAGAWPAACRPRVLSLQQQQKLQQQLPLPQQCVQQIFHWRWLIPQICRAAVSEKNVMLLGNVAAMLLPAALLMLVIPSALPRVDALVEAWDINIQHPRLGTFLAHWHIALRCHSSRVRSFMQSVHVSFAVKQSSVCTTNNVTNFLC